jgi:hypothetical protein
VSHSVSPAVWREVEYEAAWATFDARFDFKPDFHERSQPAIRLTEGCLVLDLLPVSTHHGSPGFAAGQAAVNAAALRAFVWIADGEELVALDWNHGAYRYDPARLAIAGGTWVVPVFPNGDYYIHAAHDMRWGTFGHPWQETLCIWGDELVTSLGTELLTWLPRHGQSMA